MKKCDIKGCNNPARIFGKTLSFCDRHWTEIYRDQAGSYEVNPK